MSHQLARELTQHLVERAAGRGERHLRELAGLGTGGAHLLSGGERQHRRHERDVACLQSSDGAHKDRAQDLGKALQVAVAAEDVEVAVDDDDGLQRVRVRTRVRTRARVRVEVGVGVGVRAKGEW